MELESLGSVEDQGNSSRKAQMVQELFLWLFTAMNLAGGKKKCWKLLERCFQLCWVAQTRGWPRPRRSAGGSCSASWPLPAEGAATKGFVSLGDRAGDTAGHSRAPWLLRSPGLSPLPVCAGSCHALVRKERGRARPLPRDALPEMRAMLGYGGDRKRLKVFPSLQLPSNRRCERPG